jgi:magnesium transporter
VRRELSVARDPGYRWVDLLDPDPAELEALARELDFPATVVQDCLDPEHLPKLERHGDRTFVIVRASDEACGDGALTMQEVSRKVAIFIAPGTMVTVHRGVQPFLEALEARWRSGAPGSVPCQPDLLVDLVGGAVESFGRPLEQAEDRLDAIEERLFGRPDPQPDLEALHFLKRRISSFKRVLWHSLAVIQRLPEQPGGRHAAIFQDLHETAESFYFYADELLESVNNLLGLQLSLASHRTSEVMRVLTIFSVFFLPLTFLVGVYGMNFRHLPELEWRWGYAAVWVVMLAVTALIYSWFKRRGWMR